MALLKLLLLLAAVGWAQARPARFVVEKSKLAVQSPPLGEFEVAIGDFGVPLYGGTLVGSVTYPSDNRLGCTEFSEALPASDTPRILLLDRGECFFVQKAWHAQKAGAAAVVIADHTQEQLVTMAIPEDHPDVAQLVDEINIPVVLVQKDAGDKLKAALADGRGDVVVEMDWREAIAHPDERVECEFWLSTNEGCGEPCDSQRNFLTNFRDSGIALDQGNYTQFAPHVMTRSCSLWLPRASCADDCIRGGRYCAWGSVAGQHAERYKGRQVVEENLRHVCVFKVLNDTGRPWVWWDFAARFAQNCTMAAGRYDASCAEEQMRAAGVDPAPVAACVGDTAADQPHDLLQAERSAQRDEANTGRGKVIMLPTLVINTVQYRGRLDPASVLRALCAGFREGTEPGVCLSGGLNVDDCASGKDGCWRGPAGESACVDTFRGFVCRCPKGWEGDGHNCQDIDECALGPAISGCDQKCINTPGSYRCECERGYTLHGGDGRPGICIPSGISSGGGFPVWALLLIIAGSIAIVGGGVGAYRYRLRREMHDEIRSIMRQYMPLEQQERGDLGRSLLTPHGGAAPPGMEEDEESKHHYFAPTAPPARSAPSLTELAQTASPRTFTSM